MSGFEGFQVLFKTQNNQLKKIKTTRKKQSLNAHLFGDASLHWIEGIF